MRKLFIFGILSTFFLINPCFGADFYQGEVSSSISSGIAFNDDHSTALLPSFGIGYYLTDHIKITAEHANAIFASETLASLYYYYKIKNANITPYIRAGVGVDTQAFSYTSLFVYRVSFGVSFPLSSDMNVFVGYQPKFLSLFKGDHDMSHALEFGISFHWD